MQAHIHINKTVRLNTAIMIYMKPNEWLALVDVFDLFQLKRYCTQEELQNIEKMLELEILALLSEKYSPELPNEEQTLEAVAEVKRAFIVEYIAETEHESKSNHDYARKVEALLASDTATPEDLEDVLNELYQSEDDYE